MAIPESDQLRQLVGDFYHGLVTAESYRERRAELLDNVGSAGNAEAETVRREQQDAHRSDPDESDYSMEAPAAAINVKSVAIGIVALTAAVALAYFIFGPGSAPDATTEPAATVSDGPDQQLAENVVAVIEDFVSRNDWSEENLNNFLVAWGALRQDERDQIAESRAYRRMTSSVHQRIREEFALGGSASGSQIELLKSFAATIGSPYRETRSVPSIARPNAEPREAASPPVEPVSPPDLANEDEIPEEFVTNDQPIAEPAQESSQIDVDPVPKAPTEEVEGIGTDSGSQQTLDDPCPSAAAGTRRPYCQDKLADGSPGPVLVILEPGSFEMGSENDDESPPHQVEIGYYIAMSRYEITASEYREFCAATSLPCPEQPWGDDSPVVLVSWDDAVQYAAWLSEATGFEYRLPTESEWEYAARSGTQTPYFFGNEITPSSAHSSQNGEADAPVTISERAVNANQFRLYHMSGNVREWVKDAWYPDYEDAPSDGSARTSEVETRRVVRGGSFADPGIKLRSAAREAIDRSHNDEFTGIRVVREIDQ